MYENKNYLRYILYEKHSTFENILNLFKNLFFIFLIHHLNAKITRV